MFYNKAGQQVLIPATKQLSDHARATLTEKLEPLPHKGHAFFRVEERANMK